MNTLHNLALDTVCFFFFLQYIHCHPNFSFGVFNLYNCDDCGESEVYSTRQILDKHRTNKHAENYIMFTEDPLV